MLRHNFYITAATIAVMALPTSAMARDSNSKAPSVPPNIDNMSKEEIYRLPPFDGEKCWTYDLRNLRPGRYKKLTIQTGSDVCNPTITVEE